MCHRNLITVELITNPSSPFPAFLGTDGSDRAIVIFHCALSIIPHAFIGHRVVGAVFVHRLLLCPDTGKQWCTLLLLLLLHSQCSFIVFILIIHVHMAVQQ